MRTNYASVPFWTSAKLTVESSQDIVFDPQTLNYATKKRSWLGEDIAQSFSGFTVVSKDNDLHVCIELDNENNIDPTKEQDGIIFVPKLVPITVTGVLIKRLRFAAQVGTSSTFFRMIQ